MERLRRDSIVLKRSELCLHYCTAEHKFGLIVTRSDLVIKIWELPVHFLVLHVDLLGDASEGSLNRSTTKDACWSTNGRPAKHRSKIPLLFGYLLWLVNFFCCLLLRYDFLGIRFTFRFLITALFYTSRLRDICIFRNIYNGLLLLVHLTKNLILAHYWRRSFEKDRLLIELAGLRHLFFHIIVKDGVYSRIIDLFLFSKWSQVYLILNDILISCGIWTWLRGLFTVCRSLIWRKKTILAESITFNPRSLLWSHLLVVQLERRCCSDVTFMTRHTVIDIRWLRSRAFARRGIIRFLGWSVSWVWITGSKIFTCFCKGNLLALKVSFDYFKGALLDI